MYANSNVHMSTHVNNITNIQQKQRFMCPRQFSMRQKYIFYIFDDSCIR